MTIAIETADSPGGGAFHRSPLPGLHHRAVITLADVPLFRHVGNWRATEDEARADADASPFAPGKKRRRYRWHPPKVTPDDTACERRALLYAQWLARRDGITLPEHAGHAPGDGRFGQGRGRGWRAIWSGVHSATRSHTSRIWNGEKVTRGVWERRIQAISWGAWEERYFQRKDGRRGAWTHNEWVEEFRFELPNWDFNPPYPVDEGEAEPLAVAA